MQNNTRVESTDGSSDLTDIEYSKHHNNAQNEVNRKDELNEDGENSEYSQAQSAASSITNQFDFHEFINQIRMKSAEPIVKYIKSFLNRFRERPWSAEEQSKLVHDFLEFISIKMRLFEPWKSLSQEKFELAMEGVEKLVMNKLYNYSFSPMTLKTNLTLGFAQQDDLERDKILNTKIEIFQWLEERHLDLKKESLLPNFLDLSITELLKINQFRAPRDKIICILNCCKVIYGLMRHVKMDQSADSFVPILILVLIKANPQHMISNLQYITRFRSKTRLQGEQGYYVSTIIGAVHFIETMEKSVLNISEDEYEQKMSESLERITKSNEHQAENDKSNHTTSSHNNGDMLIDLTDDEENHVIDNNDQATMPNDSVLQTLSEMFPSVDKQVVEWVWEIKHENISAAVDALLDILNEDKNYEAIQYKYEDDQFLT